MVLKKLRELKMHFHTKDLGRLRYFLGIEVAKGRHGLVLSQRKYTQALLSEIGMLGSKPAETPMDPNINMDDEALNLKIKDDIEDLWGN